jgi:hypothetical protein
MRNVISSVVCPPPELVLNETLEEEKETDEKLTTLAADVNAQANQGTESNEDARPTKNKSRAA